MALITAAGLCGASARKLLPKPAESPGVDLPAPGGRILYWIRSSRHGIIGGATFAAAGCQPVPRNDFVGWSADARMANIGLAVCSRRLLIHPNVRVRGPASQALRLAAERVSGD